MERRNRRLATAKFSETYEILYRDLGARLGRSVMEVCFDATIVRGSVEEARLNPFVLIEHGAKLLTIAPLQTVTFPSVSE